MTDKTAQQRCYQLNAIKGHQEATEQHPSRQNTRFLTRPGPGVLTSTGPGVLRRHGRTPGGPRGQGWGQLTAIKWQQEPTPRLHKGATKKDYTRWYGPHPPHCLLQLKWPLTTPLKWFTTNCLLRQFVTSRGVFKRALSRHWINSTFAQTFDVFDPGPLLFPKYGEDTKL